MIGPHENVKRNRAVRVGIRLRDNHNFSFNLLGLRKPQNKTFKDEEGVVISVMLQKRQGE